jgi:hypothetical protein
MFSGGEFAAAFPLGKPRRVMMEFYNGRGSDKQWDRVCGFASSGFALLVNLWQGN